MEKKPHLVSWATICLDRWNGGLGVKDLGRLNKALHSKWTWRFANEGGDLWNDVMRGKFGEHEKGEGGWVGYGLEVWKAIWRW